MSDLTESAINKYIKTLLETHPNCGCCGIPLKDEISKIDRRTDDVCCLDCFMLVNSSIEQLAKAIIYVSKIDPEELE
jgi:hypothetical protein